MSTISVGFAQRALWLKLAIEHGAGADEVQKQTAEMIKELGGQPQAAQRMSPGSCAMYMVSLLLANMVVDIPPRGH